MELELSKASLDRLSNILGGKSLLNYFKEKGLIKTSFGWIKQNTWEEAKQKRAIIIFKDTEYMNSEYEIESTFKFLFDRGSLSKHLQATAPLTRQEKVYESFSGL